MYNPSSSKLNNKHSLILSSYDPWMITAFDNSLYQAKASNFKNSMNANMGQYECSHSPGKCNGADVEGSFAVTIIACEGVSKTSLFENSDGECRSNETHRNRGLYTMIVLDAYL